MSRNAVYLFGALLLGACTVGPNYHRPPIDTPAAYRGAAAIPSATPESLGDLPWQEVFTDPELQRLIRKARADNADVRIAAARIDLVRAQVAAARADYAPHLAGSVGETVQRISPIGLPQDRTGSDPAGSAGIVRVEASWEIDFWGKYRRANEAGKAALLAGEAARREVSTSVVAAMASTYFKLLALDDQLAIAEESVEKYRASARLSAERAQGGVASAFELREADARVVEAGTLVRRLRQERETQSSTIGALLGDNSTAIPRGRRLAEQPIPDVGAGLPSSLMGRRPDILQAEQNLIAANADIGVAKAAYFPNIGLTAGDGRESTALHNLFTSNAATWILQPSLNVPIFTGGRIRAAVRQAEAERNIRLTIYLATVRQSFRDVSDALAYRERAAADAVQQDFATRSASEAATLAQQLDGGGVTSDMEFLRVDQGRLQAQFDRATALFQQLDATVQLYTALGGGWKE